jgi:hypothetical protein
VNFYNEYNKTQIFNTKNIKCFMNEKDLFQVNSEIINNHFYCNIKPNYNSYEIRNDKNITMKIYFIITSKYYSYKVNSDDFEIILSPNNTKNENYNLNDIFNSMDTSGIDFGIDSSDYNINYSSFGILKKMLIIFITSLLLFWSLKYLNK